MFRKYLLSIFLLFSFVFFPCFKLNAQKMVSSTDSLSSTEKNIYFTIRYGQGGFTDDRSPIGKLGGGQLALDIKLSKFPIAISVFNEYYTNSGDPTHSYEIASLIGVNFLYMTKVLKTERVNLFGGGGMGGLKVPKGVDKPDAMESGIFYNIEGGINIRAFWKIGFYGIYKYLYAQKEIDNVKVKDFSEHIILLGLTLNLSL